MHFRIKALWTSYHHYVYLFLFLITVLLVPHYGPACDQPPELPILRI
jgi:hypothetical protein